MGDYLIFSPPTGREVGYSGVHVDGALLFFQIVAIVFGTALLVWWFQAHQAITQSPSQKPNKRSILQSGTKWVAARLSDVLYGPRSDYYVSLFLLLLLGLVVLAALSRR